jgi:ribosomal protein L20A (L18A)
MTHESILNQLGYVPNLPLMEQLGRIEANTVGFDKIIKHVMDLHEALKADKSYVAMSNTHDFLKIKIEGVSEVSKSDAREKIDHFSHKYKVKLEKVAGKETYYIVGFTA